MNRKATSLDQSCNQNEEHNVPNESVVINKNNSQIEVTPINNNEEKNLMLEFERL